MAIGKGHQAIMDTAYGVTKFVNGKMDVVEHQALSRPRWSIRPKA